MGCGCSKPMPDSLTMAANATSAIGRVAGAVILGKPVVACDDVKTARLAVCAQCEHMTRWAKDETFMRCTMCGCWLNGKKGLAKVEYLTEKCPLNKWEVA